MYGRGWKRLGKKLADDLLMFDGQIVRIRPKYKTCIVRSANTKLFDKKNDVFIRERNDGVLIASPSDTYMYYSIKSSAPIPSKDAPLPERTAYFKKFKETAKLQIGFKDSSFSRSASEQTLSLYLTTFEKVLYKCLYHQDEFSNLMQTERNPLSRLPSELVGTIGSFLTGETGPLAVQKSKMNVKKGYSGVHAGKRKTRRQRRNCLVS